MSLLGSWAAGSHSADGIRHRTFRKGSGPGVVVIHEVPGITPKVIEFAEEVVARGFTVVMPSLFGRPEAESTASEALRSITRICVSREFSMFALGRTSPVATWLRSLARELHSQVGGAGVGAIGMCFTGGFALAMAVDDAMLAPVLSQPSLPFAVGRERKRALGLSDADLARVAERADLCVLAMRFTGDLFVPPDRFAHLREVLGDRVITIEIDNGKGKNPHNIPRSAHSVVTEHLVDEPGHPTQEALDRVMAFFKERLAG
jgi:dienelactone hydrolase